ncbi:5-methylcytosine-specific restriction enzyme subunit McrC [Larkinella arboricola]|uniref:5-methylcytosine-specific restriction enzyme subunit McrC n=1 Tax=Larkinella arboricola TaxID=643671 RepID=A0A327WT48_LARAB|nr:McrC family protein [Larkinella arboricola]RAJ95683.1 5-methylcytosine-specific restriction enzyme subunit McrC [Larkinella arboricola]
MPFVITEYGLIRRSRDFPEAVSSLTELYLPDAPFEALRDFVTETEADAILTFFLQKGRECIRVKNYVGLLETRDGSQLEILPKAVDARQGRKTLLRMLRYWRNSPFRSVESAWQGSNELPLWEIFITLFLDAVTPVVTRGLQKSYVAQTANQRFLKGKLELAAQIRQNGFHAERLVTTFDEQTADLPPNRLLKSALEFVQKRARTIPNQSRIRQLLFAMDDVPTSKRLSDDLRAVATQNRLFAHYQPALQWAEALLSGRAFGLTAGRHLTLALLFPMERVFEEYVGTGFKRYVTDGDVTLQESSQHLIENHGGGRKFRLRPDILLRRNGITTVLDTKWKRIDATNTAGNYGIDQADLYQLYAYGKKYGATELVLIYPATEQFQEPLELFGYDETMHLRVVPFDINQPLEEAVVKVMKEEKG